MDLPTVATPYLTDDMATRIELEPRTTGHWRVTAHGSLRHPTPNGVNDPLSILAVLDLLQSVRPPLNFTTPTAVEWLEAFYKHIIWDAVTVGRILGEISDLASEHDPELPAIARSRSARGARWTVHTDNRRQWRWLHDARVWMQDFAEKVVEDETNLRATRGRGFSAWSTFTMPR